MPLPRFMVMSHSYYMAHVIDVCGEPNFHSVLSVWTAVMELWCFFDRKLGELTFHVNHPETHLDNQRCSLVLCGTAGRQGHTPQRVEI